MWSICFRNAIQTKHWFLRVKLLDYIELDIGYIAQAMLFLKFLQSGYWEQANHDSSVFTMG
jgi:hypothetical protein